jgi:hypothetical protein
MESTMTMRAAMELGVAHACPQVPTVKAGNYQDQGWTVSISAFDRGRKLDRVIAGFVPVAPTAPITGVVYPHFGDPPV